ncbi:T9SS type A sorting domain-containing protein [Bizionia gelidisalsuginis]|uniref:T9SS type A sorting domain-containing protein n=1 Tax=Bizionia gelidisalsuginis TaxID=291188 RepID=A0ABY3ME65_9FLAO|nr:T9SS type A sorting domain-containing protein [Bizionia gelidisalsuginis]TYC17892.1 T9SS type A sorting domain-containing protein [Bizionia gelidisalsuginis]
MFAFCGSYAQVTLSQTTDNTIVSANSVACSGDGVVSDNIFYRVYDLTSYASTFNVQEVSFAVEAVSNALPNFSVDVIIYSNTGGAFPAGTLTEISRVTVPLTDAATGTIVDVAISANVSAPELVFGVETPDESNGAMPANTTGFQIGSNPNGETNPGYIYSVACGITPPSTLASIGFGTMHMVMEVRDFSTLSVDEFSINDLSISPNPTTSKVSLSLPNSIKEFTTELYSVTGQLVNKQSNNSTLDLTDLTSGIYILKIESNLGSISRKIVKQ